MRFGRNKPKNRQAKYVRENAERFGGYLQRLLINGEWSPHPNKVKKIIDRVSGKERILEIANSIDQCAELAWLNIAEPIILKRLPYYCCGSIPDAGQTRAIKYARKCANIYKYAGVTDICKFYASIPHSLVRKNLRRLFKDEKFLAFADLILAHMGDGEVGVPIGHPISHWFANVSLMCFVHQLETMDVKAIQYMDDIVMFSNNKRHLRKAILWLKEEYESVGFRMKQTYQWFQISKRKMRFLSYRFTKGFSILRKQLMYRMMRKAKQFPKGINLHLAQGMMSYFGIMGWCRCNKFRTNINQYISKNKLRRYISNESKKLLCIQAA